MFAVSFIFELPEMLDPRTPGARVNRHWNFAVKQAIRDTLHDHWQNRIPQHFQPNAKYKYDHRPRSAAYLKYKKKVNGETIDLVKTGKTKRSMISKTPTIRVGGNATVGTVTGTMRLRWPQNNRRIGPKGLTRQQLNEEIQRFADSEMPEINQVFAARFRLHLNKRLKSKRVRRRLGPQLRKLGISP
jgi:hypothetical protein